MVCLQVPDLISAFQSSVDYSSLLQHAASLDVASKVSAKGITDMQVKNDADSASQFLSAAALLLMLFLHMMQAHDVLRQTQQVRAQQKAAGAVTSTSQPKPAQGPTVRHSNTSASLAAAS